MLAAVSIVSALESGRATAQPITEIIDAAGHDAGNSLRPPRGITVDTAGNANGWELWRLDLCKLVDIDCNANGLDDACDLDPTDPDGNGLVSPDCNTNGIPDECDACGDTDGDGGVDRDDLMLFLTAIGHSPQDPTFNACADFNDGQVTRADFPHWLRCFREAVRNPAAMPPIPTNVGDMDINGAVNGMDIQSFVETLMSPRQAGSLNRLMADTNGDGSLDADDIPGLVRLLVEPNR